MAMPSSWPLSDFPLGPPATPRHDGPVSPAAGRSHHSQGPTSDAARHCRQAPAGRMEPRVPAQGSIKLECDCPACSPSSKTCHVASCGIMQAGVLVGKERDMPVRSKAVANHFLDLARSGSGLDPMKMQKLVYFAHGWHLAFKGAPLIEDEFQAWDYGPVVPTLYHEFKKWGREKIGQPAQTWEVEKTQDGIVVGVYPRHPSLDDYKDAMSDIDMKFVKDLLTKTWKTYKSFSGVRLSRLTHIKDGPWDNARQANPGLRSVGIPNGDIKKHFDEKLEANRERRHA